MRSYHQSYQAYQRALMARAAADAFKNIHAKEAMLCASGHWLKLSALIKSNEDIRAVWFREWFRHEMSKSEDANQIASPAPGVHPQAKCSFRE
jgi:hypothetical protein